MTAKPLKTIVLDIIPRGADRHQAEANLAELLSLAKTAGGIVVEKIIQKRGRPSSKTFLGEGKIEEVSAYAKEHGIELVIINGSLKPHQYVHLGEKFPQIKLWDRIDLILNIFDKHASAPEAKLQIKLARMHHEIPKIYARESTTLFERAGAGIGTRGAGEKGIEEEKRHIRNQIKNIKQKLEVMQKKQRSQRKNRLQTGMPTVAIVGYTNAGKSSLMRALTKKDNIRVDDALFVTLETKIGSLWLPEASQNVLVADTIGFIRDLPPDLVSSFLTTLEEAREADLLLHVIDISDPKFLEKIRVVEEILEQIKCSKIPKLYVLNKADRLLGFVEAQAGDAHFVIPPIAKPFSPVFTSTNTAYGLEQLKTAIAEHLFPSE